VAKPRPVPPPDRLGVKNGSNRCVWISGDIPVPASETESSTYDPDGSELLRGRRVPLLVTCVVAIVTRPATFYFTLGG
jgi:hypothetical protein